jgi:hypothetical protein
MTDLFALDQPSKLIDIDRVVAAIRTVRIQQTGLHEFGIHDAVCAALEKHAINYRREYAFGPRCRADIWVDGIVIEVKKQRPARAALRTQIARYASQSNVRAVIAVLERSISLPPTLDDKPIVVVSLNALWGIAL